MDKASFLDQTHSLFLEAHIDGQEIKVSGEDLRFKTYVDLEFDRKMRYLSEFYSDVPTLFVIFAIDFVVAPWLPVSGPLYPPVSERDFLESVEWRVLNAEGKEVDSHFSYQLPGDGTFFTTKANRQASWRKPTMSQYKAAGHSMPPMLAKPVMFLSKDGRTARIPCLFIPDNFVSPGFFCVQESEAVITLDDAVGPSLYTVTPEFLYDLSAKIVDRRKQNYSESSDYDQTIEDHVILYIKHTDRFALPLLCKPGD
jgi:hypothetical protein